MSIVRIGTRGSPLALWQANETARLLRGAGFTSEIVEIRTTGDHRVDVPLAAIGGKGLFVKELEEALDRGEIDVAVHSLKDVPSIIPERFALFGFLERGDPRDAWLQPFGLTVAALPAGAVVGTSSPRRRAQLLERHPHLNVVAIRGNVDTRIARMQDGLVLARAGLIRLGRANAIVSTFDVDEMVPAAGQGIVALEALRTSALGREAAEAINHPLSALAAYCERGVLQQFGTILDCTSCVAVHASFDRDGIVVRAFVSDLGGAAAVRVTQRGIDAGELVLSVADELRRRGALSLLERRAS
ncbi:MAG: hydroxymethylbilane synthase [Acidobacteriota bacterium]|nr:hydroxymethylbilane synthase [Acidobacteriota bacterium]